MRCRLAILGLSLSLMTSSALAQSTAPTTAPVSVAALDQTTPRGTMKLFFAADAHSDGDAIGSLLMAENFAQDHMIATMAAKRNVDRDLMLAMMKKFPDQWKGDPRVETEKQLPGFYNTIDKSDLRIHGDTAMLVAPDAKGAVTFRRVGGKWFIPLGVIVPVSDSAALEERSHQIMVQVQVMRAAISDVAAGKYPTQNEAYADIKQRVFNAALADHQAHAATQPATQP